MYLKIVVYIVLSFTQSRFFIADTSNRKKCFKRKILRRHSRKGNDKAAGDGGGWAEKPDGKPCVTACEGLHSLPAY